MWKQKIGISVGGTPDAAHLAMLAQIGFDAVSPSWSTAEDLVELTRLARASSLTVQSLHAPYRQSADIWSADEAVSAAARASLIESLEGAHACGIPVMVVHTWIGFDYTFGETRYGFRNFDEVVRRAETCGVQIAFENTEGEEYLVALMERYRGENAVGFCWDSGHEMCYNGSRDLLADYGDRLIMTHLNDNLGVSRFDGRTFWTDDLHLLPYDGIADWDGNVERLRKARPIEILNFELNRDSKPGRHENDAYSRMSAVEYYTAAYMRACRIASRYAR